MKSFLTFFFRKFLFLLVLYSLLRLLFYFINFNHFKDVEPNELLTIFTGGIRFDLTALTFINIIYIFLYFLPVNTRNNLSYQKTLKVIFIVTNALALLFACIDLFYYRFTLKRSTSDIFQMINLTNNLQDILPQFIADFWPAVVAFALLMGLLIFFFKKEKNIPFPIIKSGKEFAIQFIIFLFLSALALLAFRGGLQVKPIGIITAGKYSEAKNFALVLNTPFTIIKTAQKTPLENVEWFEEKELKKIYSPVHKLKKAVPFKRRNVVLIIMESFSKEYVGSLSKLQSYTPFLDSLSKVSYTFTNAHANGKKSIEGIPAIIAGIPALMEGPYISSAYSANQITSLATVLKDEGYNTSFFHGGTNGTMGLDAFCRMAGIEKYYGRTEYDNEKDYDGFWGIPDHLFFKYFSGKLNEFEQPFFTSFFSLSSHHPYKVPKAFRDKFPEGALAIHRSIRYADHSLMLFFERVKNEEWFKNTVFIITADHTGEAQSPFYYSRAGTFAIPLMIFDPGAKSPVVDNHVVQQIDILPGVLDYLNYSKPFFSFGKSLFDSTSNNYNVNYINGMYQILDQEYLLEFNGEKNISLYSYVKDSTLTNNLVVQEKKIVRQLEKQIKARIQVFNQALIKNKMTVSRL